MKKDRLFCSFKITLFTVVLFSHGYGQENTIFSKDLLVEDIRQFVNIIESSHPDPYLKSEGKIPFHRLFQSTATTIPEEGMTATSFCQHMRPLVTLIGDVNTNFQDPDSTNLRFPGGVPLYFNVVENKLYVLGVPDEQFENLFGAVLESVENVSVQELSNRLTELYRIYNEKNLLALLGRDNFLWYSSKLEQILPEWQDKSTLKVTLTLVSGESVEHTFDLPIEINYPLQFSETEIQIQSAQGCDFSFQFLDVGNDTALIRIEESGRCREFYESVNIEHYVNDARNTYEQYNGTDAPLDNMELLAGIPSAVEFYKSLLVEMENANTNTLIVDLRHISGKNSLMEHLLIYFLYGKAELVKLLKDQLNFITTKYSDLYFEQNTLEDLVKINLNRNIKFTTNDYDFYDNADDPCYTNLYGKMPTFTSEFESGEYSAYYKPDEIIVLCSPWTPYNGFVQMKSLHNADIKLVGVPVGATQNSFSGSLIFELGNTSLAGFVSSKYVTNQGSVAELYHELTYDQLTSYNFDPNAEILLVSDMPTGVESNTLIADFTLSQNYPNPFNTSTSIKYELPKDTKVLLTIFNLQGREVRTLVDEKQNAGKKSIVWDGLDNSMKQVSSGVYISKVKAGKYEDSKKMMLIK